MTGRPRIIAIIAAFNEADIIGPVVAELIGDGISVYLLDHGSTDGTVGAVTPFLGRGLLAVERLPQEVEGFSLRSIIARKQELVRELEFDWFINHDADEFRESPWPGVGLAEGIHRVDTLGYNAIDFEVLDFVPTHEQLKPGDDPRAAFPFYVPSSSVNKLQIRCWKKPDGPLDLISSAGHEAEFPGRRVFPIRFLLRHYPFRSQAHGERKLFRERRPRYDKAEREMGWHVQYEGITEGHSFSRTETDVVRFDGDRVRLELQVHNRVLEEVVSQQDVLTNQVEEMGATVARERLERDSAREHVSRLQRHVEELGATINRERLERDTARAHLSRVQIELQEAAAAARTEAERQLVALHGSWSWRLTRPLRGLVGLVVRARMWADDSAGRERRRQATNSTPSTGQDRAAHQVPTAPGSSVALPNVAAGARRDLGESYRAALHRLAASVAARLAATRPHHVDIAHEGGLIPTLLDGGERELALELLHAVLRAQLVTGAWSAPGEDLADIESTGSAIMALLAAHASVPGAEEPLRRGWEWLLATFGGTAGAVDGRIVQGAECSTASLRVRLLSLAALARVAGTLDDPGLTAASAGLLSGLTGGSVGLLGRTARGGGHVHLDELAALLDLRRPDLVEPVMTRAMSGQSSDGSVSLDGGITQTCRTCLAQLASAWCRLGQRNPASRVVAYLCTIQDADGGLAGADASSDRESELADRAFLDAVHWQIRTAFDQQVECFEDHTSEGDGRLSFLQQELGPLGGCRVLDAGCGRGAIARSLLATCPSVLLFGLDLSDHMLRHLPAGMPGRQGSIQNLPFPDASFDAVYCVEALEHAGNPQGAVDELCRVVKPGGRVLIVDKSSDRSGALEIEEWEQWFSRVGVERWLQKRCRDVRSKILEHCPEYGPELFIGWVGTRI